MDLDELGKTIDSLVDFKENDFNDIEKKVSAFDAVKNEIMSIKTNEIVTFDDKEFISSNLKTMIEIGISALRTVSQNVRPGSPGTQSQGFASILMSLSNTIKELIHFNKMIHDLEILHNPEILAPVNNTQNNITVNNNSFDLSELTKMIKDASKKSELNEINAKFEVEEGKVFESKPRKENV